MHLCIETYGDAMVWTQGLLYTKQAHFKNTFSNKSLKFGSFNCMLDVS